MVHAVVVSEGGDIVVTMPTRVSTIRYSANVVVLMLGTLFANGIARADAATCASSVEKAISDLREKLQRIDHSLANRRLVGGSQVELSPKDALARARLLVSLRAANTTLMLCRTPKERACLKAADDAAPTLQARDPNNRLCVLEESKASCTNFDHNVFLTCAAETDDGNGSFHVRVRDGKSLVRYQLLSSCNDEASHIDDSKQARTKWIACFADRVAKYERIEKIDDAQTKAKTSAIDSQKTWSARLCVATSEHTEVATQIQKLPARQQRCRPSHASGISVDASDIDSACELIAIDQQIAAANTELKKSGSQPISCDSADLKKFIECTKQGKQTGPLTDDCIAYDVNIYDRIRGD